MAQSGSQVTAQGQVLLRAAESPFRQGVVVGQTGFRSRRTPLVGIAIETLQASVPTVEGFLLTDVSSRDEHWSRQGISFSDYTSPKWGPSLGQGAQRMPIPVPRGVNKTAKKLNLTGQQKAGTTSSSSVFASFPREVICKIWPKERAVMGLKVCKYLKSILPTGVQGAVIRSKAKDIYLHSMKSNQGCRIIQSLQQWSCPIDFKAVWRINERVKQPKLPGAMLHLIQNLKNCESIATLDVSDCFLTKEMVEMLADKFSNSTSLESLYLFNNSFSEASSKLILPSLTALDLSFCRITQVETDALSAALAKCTALRVLNLSTNAVAFGTDILPRARLSTLTSLNLSSTVMTEAAIEKLSEAPDFAFASLTELSLTHNNIDFSGMRRLSDVLGKCMDLRSINLSNNRFGESADGMLCLKNSLEYFTNLQRLSLNSISFKPVSHDILAATIKDHPQLTRLDLACNSITELRSSMVSSLQRCTGMQWFSLYDNGMPASCAELLQRSIGRFTALTHLGLGHNKLGHKGARQIAEVFYNCNKLEAVDLDSILSKPDGTEELMDALRLSGRTLRELDFRKNVLSAKQDVQNLCSLLVSSKNLEALHLQCTDIRVNGVALLIEALRSCPKLKELDLRCNQSVTGPQVVQLLKLCTRLTSLDVQDNRVDSAGAKQIAFMLSRCPSLTNLNLKHNRIGKSGYTKLISALDGKYQFIDLQLEKKEIESSSEEGSGDENSEVEQSDEDSDEDYEESRVWHPRARSTTRTPTRSTRQSPRK